MKNIKQTDKEIFDIINSELSRQRYTLELIASENFASNSVIESTGSILTNKYAEGYPGKRYYGGCESVDMAEDLARDRLKELFNAEYANVQPHSGSQANMGVFNVFLNHMDTVMGLDLAHGGHLTHGSKVNFSGNMYNSEVETPRNDASVGLLMSYTKDKGFQAVPSKESGLFVIGDVKDMEFIKIGDTDYIVSAKNDDYLEFTRINK